MSPRRFVNGCLVMLPAIAFLFSRWPAEAQDAGNTIYVLRDRAFDLASQGRMDDAKAVFDQSQTFTNVNLEMAKLAVRLRQSEHGQEALVASSSQFSGRYSIPLRRLQAMSEPLREPQWTKCDARLAKWIVDSIKPRTAGNGWRYLRLSELEQSRGFKKRSAAILDQMARTLRPMTSRKAYETDPGYDILRQHQMLAAHYIAIGDSGKAATVIGQIAKATSLLDGRGCWAESGFVGVMRQDRLCCKLFV